MIPKSFAASVDKNGIRLKISAYEVRKRYSHSKMKRLALNGEVPKSAVQERVVYDRLHTLRYGTTRNRLAACIAFISGILFLLSGYKANIELYNIIRDQLVIHTTRDFWTYAVIPVGFLALLSQLGGLTVLMGAGLFAANRITIGKFLVMVGTGQGLITILVHIALGFWSGRLTVDNNYISWLTSTATGLGVLFSVTSSYITKGKGVNIYLRIAKYFFKRGGG